MQTDVRLVEAARAGEPGAFVYELSPADAPGRRFGRGLEGVTDAVLKAFGI